MEVRRLPEAGLRRGICALFVFISALFVGGCVAEESSRPAAIAPAAPTVARPALATPVASASPSASPLAEARTYTVRSGDTLSSIAAQVYGDASDWRPIFEANRDRLTSPESLQVGGSLRIPPREPTRPPTQ